MIARSLLVLATAALAVAAPPRGPGGGPGRGPSGPCKPTVPGDVTIELPSAPEEEKQLARPDGLVLKHVVLGHGYQNYTCTSDGKSTATGALAVLYDVTPFYPGNPRGLPSYQSWLDLAKAAFYTKDAPLNLDGSVDASTRVKGAEKAAVVGDSFKFPSKPISLSGAKGELQPQGVHYFDAGGVPTFDLGPADLFKAKKIDSVPAPKKYATPGQKGEAAVAWLYLGDAGGSIGIDFVYRVNTVGGSGHACDKAGDDSSEYTALYYFYSKA